MSLKEKMNAIFRQDNDNLDNDDNQMQVVEIEPKQRKTVKNIVNVDSIVQKGKETKKKAINKFTDIVDKEKEISKKVVFWSLVYDIVITVLYVVITIASVFTKWSDASNPLIMSFLLFAYVVAFFVMTIYTLRGIKSEQSNSTKKRNTVKNYKSASLIVKKIMKVISVGLSIMLAIEAWDGNSIFKYMSLALILFSFISMIKALKGISKEVKKIKKRENAKESKIISAKHKIEDFSDEMKKKNQME